MKNQKKNKPAPHMQPSAPDPDIHKGAVEDDTPAAAGENHPGLDRNGVPNDPTAIAQDALGAREDKTQG
jgi:hypothetical protein